MRVLGLDEAGRGCVLGPLVVGAYLWEDDQAKLTALGAADSKALSPRAREDADRRLRAAGTGRTIAIPAPALDEGNLNRLEEDAFLALVTELRPDRVYLDAPVAPAGIPRLKERLAARSGVADWVVENKADARWPVVGAASILAKVERDAFIATLGAVGSGYPSDPVTRAWLRDHVATGAPLPSWVRTKWQTVRDLVQPRLFGEP